MWSLKDRDTFFRLKMVNLKTLVIFNHNIQVSSKTSKNQENKIKITWREEEGKGEGAHAGKQYSAEKMETFL